MNLILVAEIGHEKITDLAIQIIEASAKMSIECLEGSTGGWINTPILKPAKYHNQTCFLMTQGMLSTVHINTYIVYINVYINTFNIKLGSAFSNFIQYDQIMRWKDKYPEWLMNDQDLNKTTIKGTKIPKFCSKTNSMYLGQFKDQKFDTVRSVLH